MEQDEKNYIIMKVIIMIVMILIVTAMFGGAYWYFFILNDRTSNLIENNIGEEIIIDEKTLAEDQESEVLNEITDETSGQVNEVPEQSNEETENKTEERQENITQTISKNDNTSNSNNFDTPTTPSTNDSNVSNTPSTDNSNNNSQPTLTGTDTVRELTKTETKYGVQIKTYTTIVYNVYSDGSRTVKNIVKEEIEYDRSSYSATTAELLAEAKSAKSKYSSMISQVVNNTNTYRQEANTQAVDGITDRGNLTLDNDLCVAACVRAVEMAYSKKFSHTRPNGSSCYTVLDEMGIKYWTAGENIANGQTSASSVSNSWKNSAGHYKNMINSNFTKIGVGVFKLDDGYYWVQLFN